MYHKGVLASTASTAGALPFTGLNMMWAAIGGFALLMVAGAIWRIVPRREA
jgi:hypothetical protein